VIGFAATMLLAGSALEVRAATAYETIVAPIFEARCSSCHGADRQKGKLALHTWETVARGGDSGPLFVAGKPAESELVRRLRLPEDDEERMPPIDQPQMTKAEVELLIRWVEKGASPDASVDQLGLSAELSKAVGDLPALLRDAAASARRDDVWEFDPAAVAAARAPLAQAVEELQRRFPGALAYESRTSDAVHFTAAGIGRDFTDADLHALRAVADRVVVLDLSGAGLTDAAAESLAAFRNVRVLRLGFTRIGDAVARALGGLPSLESLALTGTGVTADGLRALTTLPKLTKLHVAAELLEPARAVGLRVVDPGFAALDREPAPAASADDKKY
jgi:mono/diheme cytochrome c family protein